MRARASRRGMPSFSAWRMRSSFSSISRAMASTWLRTVEGDGEGARLVPKDQIPRQTLIPATVTGSLTAATSTRSLPVTM